MLRNAVVGLALVCGLVGCALAQPQLGQMRPADLARLKARTMCSCLFVQRLPYDRCADGRSAIWRYPLADAAPALLAAGDERMEIATRADGAVVRIMSGKTPLAQSRYVADGGGCVTLGPESTEVAHGALVERRPSEPLPRGDLPKSADARAIDAVLEEGFAKTGAMHGLTRAVVVVQGGRVAVTRYDAMFGPQYQYYLGSIAKVFNNLLAGLLAVDGRLRVDDAVQLAAWRDDARSRITYDQLLRMSSGLDWNEDFFVAGAPAYEIYFGGSASLDVAGFVATRPLEAQPGTHFEYSTGTANLLASLLQEKLGGRERAGTLRYLRERLFAPLGANEITTEFDASGTLLTGHAIYASAEDLARIGVLLLNDGRWQSQRILPEGWVNYSTRVREVGGAQTFYGAQLRLYPDSGCFGHTGVGQQQLVICPNRDLVVVWLSSVFDFTPAMSSARNEGLLQRLVAAFPPRTTQK